MNGYNEGSTAHVMPQGHSEVEAIRNPITSVMQQTNTEPVNENAQKSDGGMALAWWDDMKFYWRRSANGGFHLAPQDSYVEEVLHEADYEISVAAKDFMADNSEDYERAKDELRLAQEILQNRTGFDSSGVESNAFIRQYRDRVIIARKITGASAVSANHRLQHTAAIGGDVDAIREQDFFKSDLENARRWAFKACYYEFIATQLADGEVIKDLPQQVVDGVKRSLYDDAVERGNRLRRPTPAKAADATKLTPDQLRQMRA